MNDLKRIQKMNAYTKNIFINHKIIYAIDDENIVY